ncbi:hypothetical protein Dda_4800 [Drechslerella dactyloides]|uniref:Yippee domain-containing protein n=1 Tax=Drechslerella dactyloides TaxID=74499 RepID=A0AAD6NJF1_DREDA|nr:hypothetical protein Dda_4800 [Drechslerella dactyloides]
MPTAASLTFPRFLLPAFPRWQPALLKRHRPIEDVTAEPSRPRSQSQSSSSAITLTSDDEDGAARLSRHTRGLSHDSGCVIDDGSESELEEEQEDAEGDGEASDDDDRSYTSASSSAASLELYLDSESGYGGSTDDIRRKRTRNRTSTNASTGAVAGQSLASATSYLHCSACRTNLCFTSSVISKGFTGRHGRAYLVTNIIPSNIAHGKPISRSLQTGAHTVADISCRVCGGNLGWKYIHAEERSQRYKVGKYILETGRVSKANVWDAEYDTNTTTVTPPAKTAARDDKRDSWDAMLPNGIDSWDSDAIDADLADEEELEELFAGMWNRERAVKRRERKRQMEELRRQVDSNV